ncbi:MAG: hypothetical protein HY320_03505 [Armatimonadetes bacterium]|nr:hypothetical protein [Armatimonadota bacterium]
MPMTREELERFDWQTATPEEKDRFRRERADRFISHDGEFILEETTPEEEAYFRARQEAWDRLTQAEKEARIQQARAARRAQIEAGRRIRQEREAKARAAQER